MAVSCPPVLQRLELGVEAYVETPYRMTFCYTISLSTTVHSIYIYIDILQYYMSLLYQIISLMWMLVWRLFVYAHVYTFLHVVTASYLMSNLGIACLVSWWLVWSRRMRRSATACLFHLLHLPEYWDYFHQLPRMIS